MCLQLANQMGSNAGGDAVGAYKGTIKLANASRTHTPSKFKFFDDVHILLVLVEVTQVSQAT
jgi:hypothetical protein